MNYFCLKLECCNKNLLLVIAPVLVEVVTPLRLVVPPAINFVRPRPLRASVNSIFPFLVPPFQWKVVAMRSRYPLPAETISER